MIQFSVSKEDMCSLELLREKAIILEMFKCLHGLGPKYMQEIFNISNVASHVGNKFVLFPVSILSLMALNPSGSRGPSYGMLCQPKPSLLQISTISKPSLPYMMENAVGGPCVNNPKTSLIYHLIVYTILFIVLFS